jgi:hypothetical protein
VVSLPAINRLPASVSNSSRVEAVAVVFGADQPGDQVVGQVVVSIGDHVIEIGLKRVPGPNDVGRVLGDVPLECLEEVVGPVRKQPPVLTRGAEQRADDLYLRQP